MGDLDGIGRLNKAYWGGNVAHGDRNTVPFLELNADAYRDCAAGRSVLWPCMKLEEGPEGILLKNVRDKNVSCLASGGGKQSVEVSLMGGRVTVLDPCAGRLVADRRAADRYGYDVRTIQGDMRDLSVLAGESFDHVLQGISLTFVPDLREVPIKSGVYFGQVVCMRPLTVTQRPIRYASMGETTWPKEIQAASTDSCIVTSSTD